MERDIALLKRILKVRAERRKHISYWLAKAFRLAFLYIFKDEVLELTNWLVNWCMVNLTFTKVFHTFAFIGFVGAMGILVATLLSMLCRGIKLENLPEEIESMLKKLDSLFTEKVASL